jgi:chorismate synthase
MISVSGKKWEQKKINKNLVDKLKQDFNFSDILSRLIVSRKFNDDEIKTVNTDLDLNNVENNSIRCPDEPTAIRMIEKIKDIKKNGDTIGGVITCVIKNVPVGLGEPVFNKLHSELGRAMLTINAVKGFEFGSGFKGTLLKGSEHNDLFNEDNTTSTNNSGGIQGGISNGMDIYFNIAFKPVATIMQKQTTINTDNKEITMMGKGRHDPCVLPRAIPIVESMAALVIADYMLFSRLNKL